MRRRTRFASLHRHSSRRRTADTALICSRQRPASGTDRLCLRVARDPTGAGNYPDPDFVSPSLVGRGLRDSHSKGAFISLHRDGRNETRLIRFAVSARDRSALRGLPEAERPGQPRPAASESEPQRRQRRSSYLEPQVTSNHKPSKKRPLAKPLAKPIAKPIAKPRNTIPKFPAVTLRTTGALDRMRIGEQVFI